MSNIDVTNFKYDVDRKIYKILGMNIKNYVGTYDFYVRQTISYKKNSNGKDSKKFITIFSNAEGNYIDCKKGEQSDLTKFNFGKRCVYKKGNTIITGAGIDPKSVLMKLKVTAITKIFFRLLLLIIIICCVYTYISKIF